MTTEKMIKHVLEENFGLAVEKIPECDRKTPDYFAYADGEQYLVEVKEKGSNPEKEQARENALSNGEVFDFSQSVAPQAVLSNIIRSGKRQIAAFVQDQTTYRLIWVHCNGLGYSATREQILAGIYGAETVVNWGDKDALSGTCYYFRESQFYKYRNELDGVIISCRNSEVQICLNDHSPRYDLIRQTSLVRNFKGGVCDPPHKDREGTAFLVDNAVDRRDANAVLAYLKLKYKAEKLMLMPMQHVEAHVAVPDQEM